MAAATWKSFSTPDCKPGSPIIEELLVQIDEGMFV
jgi:hypothetical protein